MKKTLILFASHDGHTQRISEKLQTLLNEKEQEEQQEHNVALINVEHFSGRQLADYDFIILGAPIRYGKHLPAMTNFITANKSTLAQKDTAFFSVNLTARKAHRNTPETSNYIKKFFAKIDWQPTFVEVFAGKLNYSIYRFFDTVMIRFIMWVTKGPTDPNTVVDYTDWKKVGDFADRLHQHRHQ